MKRFAVEALHAQVHHAIARRLTGGRPERRPVADAPEHVRGARKQDAGAPQRV
jgi:hypothetical protein